MTPRRRDRQRLIARSGLAFCAERIFLVEGSSRERTEDLFVSIFFGETPFSMDVFRSGTALDARGGTGSG
jgi:hypothetical protein